MNKIKIDRPELSDEQILKHKNFNKITNNFNSLAKTGINSIKYWGIGTSIVVAATIILGYFYLNQKGEKNIDLTNKEKQTELITSRKAIKPPFPELDIKYDNFNIDNTKDTTIQYKNGSTIYIPANAFSNPLGDELDNKNIIIKYREFHTPYDLFVSGIPMQYDSAGQSYTFETAGMLDILAFDDNNPLILKNNKEIKINMLSNNDKSDFNIYDLDENTGIWTHKGKDFVNPINQAINSDKYVENNIIDKEIIQNLYKPRKQDKTKYSFAVKLENDISNEFVDVDNVLFEVDEDKCKFDPLYYSVDWEKINLKRLDKTNFEMTLSKNEKEINLIVYPVYPDKDYNNAIRNYNYNKEKIQKQKAEVLSKRKTKLNDQNNIVNMNDKFLQDNFKPKVFRSLSINSLGIVNIDKPIIKEGEIIYPNFVDNKLEIINTNVTYVVEKDKNLISKFSGNVPTVIINSNVENVMWTLTKENKIAIPNQQEVNKNIKSSNKKHTYQVDEYENIEGLSKIKELTENKTDKKTEVETKTFPNPFTNKININLSEENDCIVQLLNSNGQMIDNVMFFGKHYVWNIDKYAPGNYLLVVLIPSLEYRKTFKVIKQ